MEIMHRDLKPQNLLLDDQFNIKFIDFGDAKKENEPPFEEDEDPGTLSESADTENEKNFLDDMIEESKDMVKERRGTFVGTVNYLAPEMIQECQATCASDLWAFGCIIFKALTGKVPFPGTNITTVYPLILARKVDWPKDLDPQAKDLIDKLLQLDPLDRLGCKGTSHDMEALKAHPFFGPIDFRYKLIDMHVKELLDSTKPEPISKKSPQVQPTEVENSKFTIPKDGKPVLAGKLLKRNRWFMQQERKFELFANGDLKYFKGSDHKGTMVLTKRSKARKTGRTDFEIVLPDVGKLYKLV